VAEDTPQPTESTPDAGSAESAPSLTEDAQPLPTEIASEDSGFLKQEDLDALFESASAEPGGEVAAFAAEEKPEQAGAGGSEDSLVDAVQSASISPDATRELIETPPDVHPFQYPDFGTATVAGVDAKRVTMLNDVKLRVKIELGRTRMLVEEVLKLGEGSVVELQKLAGDPVDVYANDRLVARGEVLVLDDSFCVRINEVVSRDPHRITH